MKHFISLALVAATGCDVAAGLDEIPTADIAPGCSGTRLLRDFGDGMLDHVWAAGGSAAIQPTGNAVRIAAPANTGDDYIQSTINFDVRDDAVSVGVDLGGAMMVSGSVRLDLYTPLRTQAVTFNLSGDTLHFTVYDKTVTTDVGTLRYDPDAHRYWRISQVGRETRWETSPDDNKWTTRATAPDVAFMGYTQVRLGVGTGSDPIDVTFDDLNASAATGVVCRASVLADDFDGGSLSNLWYLELARGGAIEQTNGQLVATLDGTMDGLAHLKSSGFYDLSDSSLAFHIVQMPDIATDAALVFAADTLVPGVGAYFTQARGSLTARVSGTGGGEFGSAPWDPELQSWWRMRGENGLLHFEVSGDGSDYKDLAAVSDLDLERVPVRLYLTGSQANTVIIDDFNIPPP